MSHRDRIPKSVSFCHPQHIAPNVAHYPMSRVGEAFARLERGEARCRIVLGEGR